MADVKAKAAAPDRIQLNADLMRQALRVCIVAERGAIVLGSPGGGKTSVVRSEAGAANAAFIASPPLPTLDPTDLRGIPRIETIDGVPRTVWSVPDFLPMAPPASDSGLGVILYDDFTTAPPAVQAPFYQLWLEGHLGNYKMPGGWIQFATGNYDTDRAGTHRSLTPMRSRWITLHLGSDPETFARGAVRAWADGDGDVKTLPTLSARPRIIRPEIVAFIRFRPETLNQFNADALSYPCERSWEIASDVLYAIEALGNVDGSVEHALLAGCVGMGAAAELLGFLRHARSLPDIDSIIRHPKKAIVPKEPAALYAVAAALARKASVENFAAVVEYLGRIPKEFQVFSVRDAITRDGKIAKTKSFVDWSVDNQGVIVGGAS